MRAINELISRGLLRVDPSIAIAPDPICVVCQVRKVHRKLHVDATGHISSSHKSPGAGVSADQMEAGSPGKIFSTKGLPSQKRFCIANLWVIHYSRLIFVTFHETKEASELLKSKQDLCILLCCIHQGHKGRQWRPCIPRQLCKSWTSTSWTRSHILCCWWLLAKWPHWTAYRHHNKDGTHSTTTCNGPLAWHNHQRILAFCSITCMHFSQHVNQVRHQRIPLQDVHWARTSLAFGSLLCFWLPSICSCKETTGWWHPTKVESTELFRGVCWAFFGSLRQSSNHLQPKDYAYLTPISRHIWWSVHDSNH